MKNTISILRRKRNIKQYDLAKALKVSPSYLCKIEKGIIEPTEKLIRDCARILKVPQEELFFKNNPGGDDRNGTRLSNQLWAVRKERGIKQYALAQMVGCSPSYLSKVEKGYQHPNPQFKKKCAKVLKIKEVVLFPI